jgi:hypothetical protein
MWLSAARKGVLFGPAVAAAAAGLAGCADLGRVTSLSPAPVDASSPVAAEVRAASRAKTALPKFRDVPPVPSDVRPPAAFATAVADSVAARDRLETWVAANPPTLPTDPQETEAFAAAQRARIPAGVKEAPPPESAGTEDFAARLRDLATPPPPPR